MVSFLYPGLMMQQSYFIGINNDVINLPTWDGTKFGICEFMPYFFLLETVIGTIQFPVRFH